MIVEASAEPQNKLKQERSEPLISLGTIAWRTWFQPKKKCAGCLQYRHKTEAIYSMDACDEHVTALSTGMPSPCNEAYIRMEATMHLPCMSTIQHMHDIILKTSGRAWPPSSATE